MTRAPKLLRALLLTALLPAAAFPASAATQPAGPAVKAATKAAAPAARPAVKPAVKPAAKPAVKVATPTATPAAAPARTTPPATLLATAALVHADGTPAGLARIAAVDGHAVLVVELTGMPAGEHGLHLHTVGKCDAPAFTSAGGHLNPGAKQHGADNPAGSHLGDLPNLTADAAGKISARIHFGGDPQALAAALFDADGSALVLHAGPDDYKTDPSGNSGGRIACGVLNKG